MRQSAWGIFQFSLFGIICLTLSVFFAPTSNAQIRQSAIIIDAQTRTVLYAEDPDGTRYPASLTKIMTLYMVFDALERGRLRLDQQLPVSGHAAAQAPSILGLRPGSTIQVEDAILGVATKSANDAAVVLAEALGGSEAAFGQMMTARARALGMQNSHFQNASGLPNPAQRTTARDMATLALAVINNHPKYYHYFSTREFTYEGRTHLNHNKLLGTVDGVDGIKTGFINASGFNLVASAKRDGKRIVGVIFGGNTGRERDREMARLLDASFVGAIPRDKNEIRTAAVSQTMKKVAAKLNPVSTAEAATIEPNASINSQNLADSFAQNWAVQVGAFAKPTTASQEAQRAIAVSAHLPDGQAVPVALRDDSGKYYRARVGNLSEGQAREACRDLGRKQIKCLVVSPQG